MIVAWLMKDLIREKMVFWNIVQASAHLDIPQQIQEENIE